jgi:hypothetical protein
MQPSPAGFAVCIVILAIGYAARAPLLVGLVASLAFGATSLMTIGGSSPLIYLFFSALLVAVVAAKRQIWRDLGETFGSMGPIWVLCALMLYGAISAVLFPRLFAGATSVFVQSPGRKGIIEATLAPVSGNITQTGYFVIGGVTAIALCVLLLRRDGLEQVRRAFLIWICLHVGMGLLDLFGKLVGLGDLLAPIRTANYSMLTEASEAGWSRIAGAYSEASAFGGVSLSCLAFTFTYWRRSGDRLAKWLTAALLVLIALSTSSTAYVGLMLLAVPVALSLGRSALSGRLRAGELGMMGLIAAGVLVALAIALLREGFFDPVIELIDATVVDKSSSVSGKERTYWNVKSLEAFVDTFGLGVGLGSSRASSWPVAVLSQLGVIGSVLMAMLLFVILRGLGRLRHLVRPETRAVAAGVRAAALGSVTAGSLVSGTPDPGMIFLIAFAVITATRARARMRHRASIRAERWGRPPSAAAPAVSA